MLSPASIVRSILFTGSLLLAFQARANPCTETFQQIAATQNLMTDYANLLQHFSPADERRIRKVIEALESKGVSRDKIVREIRQGSGVCGI